MIRIEHVSKSYEKRVLTDITFSVKEGEIVGISGPSGSGKTTLLNIMMNIEKHDTGELHGLNKGCSAVFQEDRLLEELNAIDNIRFVCDQPQYRIKTELNKIIPEINHEKKIKELSGGMKRRVCIVRAMIAEADIIFMDEPFKGLDEKNKRMTMQYVLQQKGNRTLFVVSHENMELVMLGTDKNIRLKETGEIEQIDDHYKRPGSGNNGITV